MSDDELAGLAGPIGLGQGEKVPNQLRILAAQENLGTLRSVHRPTTWLGRITVRGRFFVFDQGVVLEQGDGARLMLFRVGTMRIREMGGIFLLAGPHGRVKYVATQWSDGGVLANALTGWAPTHPWQ
ncbi:hypothetical protein [Actinospica sp.]|jgi:hypothetical protein|uniref:hypothetical protein n=1 Tax=Actinospica sp. TaxID=1872142 RepID=UPI002C91F9F5|nr:hypothetical protein [Actinospica sp.]HWG25157.1 hypothetical protein [Actinospica sp.]